MGVRLKPAEALAFKRGGRAVVPVLPPIPLEMPEAPAVNEYAVSAWRDFWRQPVSGLVNMQRDGEHLRYWCWCVGARHELQQEWESTTHPRWKAVVWRQIRDMSAEIARAEAKFGMNPLDKMRLTGALDSAEKAETNIKARREGRRPSVA